jgi:hypothetical protein
VVGGPASVLWWAGAARFAVGFAVGTAAGCDSDEGPVQEGTRVRAGRQGQESEQRGRGKG